MNKLLIICGPTATGKTSLGIKLAQKFGGEIVNADSRQVYRGMNVGTGKDLPEKSNFEAQILKLEIKKKKYGVGYYLVDKVPIWLLDVVEPDYRFSVADYTSCAVLVINNIWGRGKLPILIGGTGFYIKSLIDGIDTIGIGPDWGLREKLQNSKTPKLQRLLKKIDIKRFNRMNQSDKNNPRRLIRAIEIAKQFKIQGSGFRVGKRGLNLKEKNLLMVGLRVSYKALYERIDKRAEKRLRQGLLKEIGKLISEGYTFNNSALGTTLAYKEWRGYFKNDKWLTANNKFKKETIQKWKYNEHHYARRQMTWFRKEKRINWFDINQKGFSQKVEELVKKWYINKEVPNIKSKT